MNKRARLVKLHITRRYPGDLPPIFIKEIPDEMPRNDIFDWLKAKYPLSDKNIISISAELIEPDGCECTANEKEDHKMETCRDCRSFENECPLLKMRGPYSTYPDHVCKFFWNKNKRIIRLTVDHRRMPRYQSTGEIPIDIPRNDIFDWLKAKYPLSDKNIISISAELIEPDGCEYRSVGDYDWILVKREL